MTTQVIVKANHGWPVKVTGVDPSTGETSSYGGRVEAGQEGTFHCHSTMDLVVHEIQPSEEPEAA